MLGSIRGRNLVVNAIGLNCKIRKARRQDSEKFVGSRGLMGSSTWGRLGLEGLLLFVCSNLFSNGLISTRKVAERFFVEFFGFLFDNTSWRYLVFASLFPTL